MQYWLFKSEPDVFGWDHLVACPKKTTPWDGVRNYQARNLLRDEIQKGDFGFFYHSRVNPPGIVGTVKVVRSGYPDPTQHNPEEKYYDPKSDPNNPRWFVVDVQAQERFQHPVALPVLKETAGLESMMVIRKGARLSVQPVSQSEWQIICRMGGV